MKASHWLFWSQERHCRRVFERRFDVWDWADLAFTKTHTAGARLGFVHPSFSASNQMANLILNISKGGIFCNKKEKSGVVLRVLRTMWMMHAGSPVHLDVEVTSSAVERSSRYTNFSHSAAKWQLPGVLWHSDGSPLLINIVIPRSNSSNAPAEHL